MEAGGAVPEASLVEGLGGSGVSFTSGKFVEGAEGDPSATCSVLPDWRLRRFLPSRVLCQF